MKRLHLPSLPYPGIRVWCHRVLPDAAGCRRRVRVNEGIPRMALASAMTSVEIVTSPETWTDYEDRIIIHLTLCNSSDISVPLPGNTSSTLQSKVVKPKEHLTTSPTPLNMDHSHHAAHTTGMNMGDGPMCSMNVRRHHLHQPPTHTLP